MPITEREGKYYWGKQGPFDSRKKAEDVAQAAYASGYQKSMDVFDGILQKLEAGWVYASEFPPPEGAETRETENGSPIWRKFSPRDKTPEEKTAMAHAKTTVGNHVAESDLPRDSKILDFGAGRGTQSRRLQGIGEYAPHEQHGEHAPDEKFTNVHSYDTQPPYDDHSKLNDKYDAVMASNVLNVQADDDSLTSTLDQLKGLLNDNGHIIANFPSTPNKHPDIQHPDEMESRLKGHFGDHNVEKVKARHWKVTDKPEGLQKIEIGGLTDGGERKPTAAELNKPTTKKGGNMNSYKDLQNFYKESYEIDKAQKVDNPWAVARAIVDGKSGRRKGNPGHQEALWGDKIDPNASEEEKRSMMGRIVAGIEQNKWNKMLKAVDIEKAGESYMRSPGGGKHLSAPPRPGEVFNPQTSRWQKLENVGHVYQSNQGQKRHRSTHVGSKGSKSVSGHGKGQVREQYAGRKGVERGERLEPGHDVKDVKHKDKTETKKSKHHKPVKKELEKKMGGAMGALAGWWLGGEIQDIIQGHGSPTPAQQREFERQIQRQMRRGIKKDTSSMDALQTFYSDANDTYIRRTPVKNGVNTRS